MESSHSNEIKKASPYRRSAFRICYLSWIENNRKILFNNNCPYVTRHTRTVSTVLPYAWNIVWYWYLFCSFTFCNLSRSRCLQGRHPRMKVKVHCYYVVKRLLIKPVNPLPSYSCPNMLSLWQSHACPSCFGTHRGSTHGQPCHL